MEKIPASEITPEHLYLTRRQFIAAASAVAAGALLSACGITTDGSPLYPVAIQAVGGELPHQLCEFHILKDLNQATLRAVAQVRKQLAAQQPKLGRGRPTGAKRKLVQKRQRLQEKIAELFEYR